MNEVHRDRFLPNVVAWLHLRTGYAPRGALLETVPRSSGAPTAYVCERFSCRLPVTRPEDLAKQLAEI